MWVWAGAGKHWTSVHIITAGGKGKTGGQRTEGVSGAHGTEGCWMIDSWIKVGLRLWGGWIRVRSCESALTASSFGFFRKWEMKGGEERLIMWSADSPYRNWYREGSTCWMLADECLCFDMGLVIPFPVTAEERRVKCLLGESCPLTCHHHMDTILALPFPAAGEFPRLCCCTHGGSYRGCVALILIK